MAERRLSIVFMGGRQAGCVGLLACAARCRVLAVVAYDAQVGALADELGLSRSNSVRDVSLREPLAGADLLVSVHGREIVPPSLLELPRHGGINVHPCLSAYKGARPTDRLLHDGGTRASVGVHRMTERVDEGEILVEEFVDVAGLTDVVSVYNALYPYYALVLLRALGAYRDS